MSRYDAIPDALVTADLGEGVGVQPVVDWSVSRQMSGGGLPGQARGASGSSVGSGSVTVHSPAGRSPWTPGPIRPGGTVGLSARADTAALMLPVARMVARDVSGSASSRALSVTIEDDIEALKAPQTFMVPPEFVGVPLDAAGVIAVLAAQAGRHAVPPPVASALVAFPLVGTPMPALGVGGNVTRGEGLRYLGSAAGMGATGPFSSVYGLTTVELRATGVRQVPLAQPVYATVDFGVALYVDDGAGGGSRTWLMVRPGGLRVVADTVQFYIAVQGVTGGWANIPPAGPPITRRWRRVQYQTEWVGPFSGTVASGARARARLGPSGAWSEWATVSGPFDTADPDWQEMGASVGFGAIRGYQTHTEDDPAVWTPPTARIEASGSTLTAALPAPARSAWETMQEIARATLGWVGIDVDGVLVYRGRDALRGGAPVETIVSEDSLEDLPWAISADDVADRVEVTYRPPVMLTTAAMAQPRHTVWESTEPMMLLPAQTLVVEDDIEGAASGLASLWIPVWSAAFPPEEHSRWNAYPNPDGTGAQPADSAIRVTSTLLAANRIRITVTNTTAGTLYVTNLIQRARTAVRAGEAVTLSQGATATAARSTLAYDLGTWCQDYETAQDVLDWLAGTTSEPLPTLAGVRVIPDAARRLGQVVKVVDRTTNLTAKALITGIANAGSDGTLTQTLDLTILWVTESDVARRWAALALSTEASVATYLTTTLGAGATEADLAAWLPTGVI